jgi:hypothetical protein
MEWGDSVWSDTAPADPPGPAVDWRKSIPREFVARTSPARPGRRAGPEPVRPETPLAGPASPGHSRAPVGPPPAPPWSPATHERNASTAARTGDESTFGPAEPHPRDDGLFPLAGSPGGGGQWSGDTRERGAEVSGPSAASTRAVAFPSLESHRGTAAASSEHAGFVTGESQGGTGFLLADDRGAAALDDGGARTSEGRGGPTQGGRHLARDETVHTGGTNGTSATNGTNGTRTTSGTNGSAGQQTAGGGTARQRLDSDEEELLPGVDETGPWNELDREIARALAVALASKLGRYVNGSILPLVADELARLVGSRRLADDSTPSGEGRPRHFGEGMPPRR